MKTGRFVVLEGVEGTGKSTQGRMLCAWLEALGLDHVFAREPGGTAVGEAIRTVVQDRPDLDVPPETELLLYTAARAAFVRDIVRPALARGAWVVADRFSLSTYAYQGYGRELDLDAVMAIDRFATGGLVPDLYLLLDAPVDIGLGRQARAGGGPDRIEREGEAFLERVRRGYLELAAHDPSVRTIDASGAPEHVHARVRAALRESFPRIFPSSGG